MNFPSPARQPNHELKSLRILRLAVALSAMALLGLTAIPSRSQTNVKIITWGENSADWNRMLHVSGIRVGCSDAPISCLRQVDHLISTDHVSAVFLATLLNSRSPSDAATYASQSSSRPGLAEVGFDDFVSQSEKSKLNPVELSALLVSFANNLRSQGSTLKFGVTVYQDQISSGELDRLNLDPQVLKSVDYVHLFPHYRKENQPTASAVENAKRVFPNAKVILGSYAYDRRAYLPCSKGASQHCSEQDEIKLYEQAFQEGLSLARSGAVVGIEFYPGEFGKEDSWKYWDNPRFCDPGERSKCIQITRTMRQAIRDTLGAS